MKGKGEITPMKKILRGILFVCLLALLLPACALGEKGGYAAVVANPKTADRLILRRAPTQDGEVLGRFYSGTPVYVVSESGAWAFVRIGGENGGLTGYMKTEFLMKANRNHGAPSLFFTSYAAGASAPIYEKQSTGSRVLGRVQGGGVYVLGDMDDDWRYVYDGGAGIYGYVRTAQLKAPCVDFYAWLTPAEGETAVAVYADKECQNLIALYESTVSARVVGLSRAKGWAQVEIRGNRNTTEPFQGRFTAGYVRQENLTVFKQPWEMMYNQRVAYALKNIPITDQKTGEAYTIPAGARLKVLGKMAGGTMHICYGGPDSEYLVDYVPAEALHTESRLTSSLDAIPRRGYLLLKKQIDAEGWNLGVAAYAAPQETKDGPLTYLYEETVELLAVLGNGWYQARTYDYASIYIRYGDGDPLYLDSWLTPGGVQLETLYQFTAKAGETASITLKNQAWGLDQAFTITDASYVLFIPEGTEVAQNGGTLVKTRVDGLQPLVPECTSPEEGETLFAGSGRFFCDQQAGGTNITYYSYIITPMNGYEDSYYVLSSLNTENGEAIREDLAPGDSVMLDRQLFGMFLEVHNCRIQLFYGNG